MAITVYSVLTKLFSSLLLLQYSWLGDKISFIKSSTLLEGLVPSKSNKPLRKFLNKLSIFSLFTEENSSFLQPRQCWKTGINTSVKRKLMAYASRLSKCLASLATGSIFSKLVFPISNAFFKAFHSSSSLPRTIKVMYAVRILLYIIHQPMLAPKLLKPRLATIVGSGELAAAQIEKLVKIFSMKRDADVAYNMALENISKEIEVYLEEKTGFLTEMMANFQSYLATIHQNKLILINGYLDEVIDSLNKEKPYKINESFVNRVNQEEHKIEEVVSNIKQLSKKMKEKSPGLHLPPPDKQKQNPNDPNSKEGKSLDERFWSLWESPEQGLKQLSDQVVFLESLASAYSQTTGILVREETKFLENKANSVFDNIMRVFILELSFMKSIEFDVNNILRKIKDQQENNRKLALEEFKSTSKSNKFYVTKYLWDKYNELTKFNFNLLDPRIPLDLQERWAYAIATFKPYIRD